MYLQIAGLVLNGVGTVADLMSRFSDVAKWEEKDLPVNQEWLELALKQNILQGRPEDFAWVSLPRVPATEMKGTHAVVLVYNSESKVKYRLTEGYPGDVPNLLLRKL
jgi:hypothetical protein